MGDKPKKKKEKKKKKEESTFLSGLAAAGAMGAAMGSKAADAPSKKFSTKAGGKSLKD
jgi:hypothetical protein|tara:strand:+ start:236 stop:409 length:174 start_codon:yes stop_codon:yes gene_type:complete